jgi:hypothetical protein
MEDGKWALSRFANGEESEGGMAAKRRKRRKKEDEKVEGSAIF